LDVEGVGATQVRSLAGAERQARDYLDTVDPDADHSDWPIDLVLDLGDIAVEVGAARAAVTAAATAQVEAGRQMRGVVAKLRAAGLSMADTAAVLGVSKGRVSQLV
jgi:DNA-directed RNA polymerase specialized sigma24 family protein